MRSKDSRSDGSHKVISSKEQFLLEQWDGLLVRLWREHVASKITSMSKKSTINREFKDLENNKQTTLADFGFISYEVLCRQNEFPSEERVE
jgi:hypothetical protein